MGIREILAFAWAMLSPRSRRGSWVFAIELEYCLSLRGWTAASPLVCSDVSRNLIRQNAHPCFALWAHQQF
jgi:hypothetical protein